MSDTFTRRTTPATPKAFTEATWESMGYHYGRGSLTTRDWMTQHDLSVQLWNAVDHWDFESAASAVEAAGSHLPVLISWATQMGEAFGDQVQVSTGYAIIDHVVFVPGQDPRLRLRYSGFSHDVYASQVRTIEQVGMTTSWEPAPTE